MHHRNDIRGIILVALGVLLGGCSTYEVQDRYVALENETETLKFKQDDAEVWIGINPDTRFYSIGVLGLPLIPTVIKGADSKVLLMELRLTLRQDRDFSFAQRPCLTGKDQDTFCPSEASVSAIALSQDDGSMHSDKQKRWHHISNFYQATERTLKLEPAVDSSRIDRRRIYQHYAYVGTPEFGYMQVNVRYTYECPEKCPKHVRLNTFDLVSIDNWLVPVRQIDFEKRQQGVYRPVTVVQ